MINLNEKIFDTRGVSLNYAEIANDKPPLVMLHGGSVQWDSLEVLFEELSAEYHIYAPELRGHGKSGWVPNSYTLQHYTDDITTFLEQVVGEPAPIFGHSLGGMIGLMIAAQAPHLVRTVMVGDSPLSAETWITLMKSDLEMLSRHRDLAYLDSEEEICEKLSDYPDGRRQWIAHNFAPLDPDTHTIFIDDIEGCAAGYENVHPLIKCPILLLQADPENGGLMTNAGVADAMRLLDQPTHVLLKGISHILQNEQKEPVLQAIQTFLKQL